MGPWAPTGASDTKWIICVDMRTSTEGSLLWKSQQWFGVKTLGLALSSMQCTNALPFQLKMHHWIPFLAVNDSIAAGPLALDHLVRNPLWSSLSELLELCAGIAQRTHYLRDKWQICLFLCIDPLRRTGCMTFERSPYIWCLITWTVFMTWTHPSYGGQVWISFEGLSKMEGYQNIYI